MELIRLLIQQLRKINEKKEEEFSTDPYQDNLKELQEYMEKWLEYHEKLFDHDSYYINKKEINFELIKEFKELHKEVIEKYGG